MSIDSLSEQKKGTTVEALKQSLMDCRISCTSSLPRIWAIETLACSNHVDISLILDLLKKTPEIRNDIGRNARELVSLKILESLLIRGARANPALSQTIELDPSESCENVLRRILNKTSPTYLISAGKEVSKWDLEPYIEHKRSNLPKYALKQLKDAIYTGSHSILASLKEQSGLPVGNHADPEALVKDGNCDGITHRVEQSDTNDSSLLPRDLPDENRVRVNRKRRATSESAAGTPCTNHINSVKKYKHDNISTEQNLGGKLISSGADRQIEDMFISSLPQIEGKSYGYERRTHFGSLELHESPKDDDNGCTSSKELVGPDEVLHHGKQVAHCYSELNNEFEEQGQDQNIEEAKGDKNGFSVLKRTNDDRDKSEKNIQNLGEVEELAHMSNDNDGNNDDRIDFARKENASFGSRCTYSQDSSTETTCGDPNLLAGTSKIYSGEERCTIEKKTCVEVLERNGPSGDGNNQSTSSKGLILNDEVVSHEKQAPHCSAEVLNENFDKVIQHSNDKNAENGRKCFIGLISMNEDVDKFERNVQRIIPTVGEAEEDVDKSTDNDKYHDEMTNIDTKKKLFLSSQCTYCQGSLATTDWREQLCIKCNNGGKLLSCASDSCPLVIHHSCLGSDASFDTEGKFYCPFCAYSQAISKYIEVKKKATLARKDLATFICLGPRQESKKHSQRSVRVEGNHLQQNDGLSESNELNQRHGVEVSNHRCRKKFEFEKTGHSELHSGYIPSFGGKALDSTSRLAQSLRQVSQSLRVNGQQQIAALEILNSRGETTSSQVSETSGSGKHADVRSKKGVFNPPEMDLPCECKCSQSSEPSDGEELSEEDDENSGASKYFVRVRKQERKNFFPAVPQLRRKRILWTSIEEDKLKEGMLLLCNPQDKIIPWKKILEFGNGVFQPSRNTMDLRDKWRNMCKGSPKSK